MPTEIAIDPARLRELALDPKNGVKEIVAGLGMSDPTFYQQLDRHPELKTIYQQARDEMRAARNGGNSQATNGRPKKGRRKSTQSSNRKSEIGNRKSAAPPPQGSFQNRAHGTLSQASSGV